MFTQASEGPYFEAKLELTLYAHSECGQGIVSTSATLSLPALQ